VLTENEQLSSIAAAVRRIEDKQSKQDDRLDKLERFADRAEGAITLARWTFSFLGIGGVGLLILAASGRLAA